MLILGISAFYHDSAAALIEDGEIIAAAHEERFSRKKHDERFPVNAIKFCLEYSGHTLEQVDCIAFYDKPLLKFERLLETYYRFAPRGIASFFLSMTVWLKEKLFIKKLIRDEFRNIGNIDFKKVKLLFPEHHLSHAASAYFASPYNDAAILTIDGVGEWATASVLHAKDNSITNIRELHFPDSVGLLYSAFTYYLGFKVNSGEYKLMGLAPYGEHGSESVKKFESLILNNMVTIFEDGSISINQHYFDYATGLKMVNEKRWAKLLGISKRKPESEMTQEHCNLALAIQNITEVIVIKMAAEAKRLTGSDNICLAGGVALNCVANGKLLKSGIFKNIYIQPAAGDAGGALGAAYAAYHIYYGKPKVKCTGLDMMKGSYLGPDYSEKEVMRALKKYNAVGTTYSTDEELCKAVAALIAEGNVIGWLQGRMEWGPRSLGNRSILGDPRNREMQMTLNQKIKYRESFRPFAPSVLAEDCNKYFELETPSPYMLFVADVIPSRRNKLPENYEKLPLKEKLYYLRSDIPAITHLDFSARIQTVHKETNLKYWQLIDEFKKLTGYGLLINTSFNVRGEPIVCSPDNAYRCFMSTEMNYLVINNVIFDKTKQAPWPKEKELEKAKYLD